MTNYKYLPYACKNEEKTRGEGRKKRSSGARWWIRTFPNLTLNEKSQDNKEETIF
jgi:hypothetical protein